MTDDDKRSLRPATVGEVKGSLSFALRFAGRRRVLMKRPDAAAPSTSGHKHPHEG
jgi:hypothetical protein